MAVEKGIKKNGKESVKVIPAKIRDFSDSEIMSGAIGVLKDKVALIPRDGPGVQRIGPTGLIRRDISPNKSLAPKDMVCFKTLCTPEMGLEFSAFAMRHGLTTDECIRVILQLFLAVRA